MGTARNITDTFPIPGEPGEFAIIRKMSWRQLKEAREARADASLEKMKRAGGDLIAVFSELSRKAEAEKKLLAGQALSLSRGLPAVIDVGDQGPAADEQTPETPKPRRRLLDNFDLGTVLKYGVANLSYFKEFKAADVDDVDEPTAEAIGEAILTFSGVGRDEQAEQKNG
jgi:hypothetical protein